MAVSLDWPPSGTSILLDVTADDVGGRVGTQASRVQWADDHGLAILPPRLLRAAGAELTGAPVLIRWHDPDNGISLVHGTLGPIDGADRRTPWHVTLTSAVTRSQRRRFVRELIPGDITVTQPRVRTRSSADAWTTSAGITLRGTLVDLGEGGTRMITDQAPFLDLSTTVRAQVAPVGGQPFDVAAEVLRIERTDDLWTVVVQFPESYEHMRGVRALVFAAMRDRVRIAAPPEPDPGPGAVPEPPAHLGA